MNLPKLVPKLSWRGNCIFDEIGQAMAKPAEFAERTA
jgi:hypothetical protein